MKKLILIIVLAFGMNAQAQDMNQWATPSECQDNRFCIFFFSPNVFSEHHVIEWKDTSFVNVISDTVRMINNGQVEAFFTASDINSFKATTQTDVSEIEFSGTNSLEYIVIHSLGYTPTSIFLQATSEGATTPCYITDLTATTFKIVFVSQPAIGTNNIRFYFTAHP